MSDLLNRGAPYSLEYAQKCTSDSRIVPARFMQLAGNEAKRSGRDAIDAEQILLGLLMEGSGVAASVLKNLGIDAEALRKAVADRLEPAAGASPARKLPLSPRAKQVLEHAIDESCRLGHKYVGTEHLLLGLLRVHDAIVADVFVAVGVTTDRAREEIARLLNDPNVATDAGPPPSRIAGRWLAKFLRFVARGGI